MSYRLINANDIAFNSDGFITAENIEKMPCIYADLPNGMDGEHYVLEQEPKTDGMTNGEVIQTLFPNASLYEHGSTYSVNNEYNFNSTWWNAPYKAESGDKE